MLDPEKARAAQLKVMDNVEAGSQLPKTKQAQQRKAIKTTHPTWVQMNRPINNGILTNARHVDPLLDESNAGKAAFAHHCLHGFKVHAPLIYRGHVGSTGPCVTVEALTPETKQTNRVTHRVTDSHFDSLSLLEVNQEWLVHMALYIDKWMSMGVELQSLIT